MARTQIAFVLARGQLEQIMVMEKIVAVAFLTETELQRVGSGLAHAYPLNDAGDFSDLLDSLDAVEWLPQRKADKADG